jgi:hypothetical protein
MLEVEVAQQHLLHLVVTAVVFLQEMQLKAVAEMAVVRLIPAVLELPAQVAVAVAVAILPAPALVELVDLV